MRTYRLWYILDVSYEDEDPGGLEDAVAYGDALERKQRDEEVVLLKAEKKDSYS